jgi:hypothetical protein
VGGVLPPPPPPPSPQELEGRGNHYHFVLPRDMAIDAGRLLEEVGPVGGHSAGGELLEGGWH